MLSTTRSLRRLSQFQNVRAVIYRCSTNTPSSSIHSNQQEEKMKRLDVAVVGLPNAGKSQLLNVLTQSPVSAVSRKRHTTRQRIMGARTVQNTQLIFVDTPGFLKVDQAKKEGLDRNLVVTASAEIANVDFSLLVVDAARNLTDAYKETLVTLMLYTMQSEGREEMIDDNEDEDSKEEDVVPKFGIVLNKVDLVNPKPLLLEYAMELSILAEESIKYAGQTDPEIESKIDPRVLEKIMPPIFYTSALKDEGVDDVLEYLLDRATPSHDWPMDPWQSTSLSAEERVEEIIREKIYRCLHKEVPYNVKQANKLLRVASDRQGRQGVVIHQEILVQTKSHRDLVMGSLERIRDTSKIDLQKLFACPVNLHLQVKHVKSRNRDWSI
eukprot:scaffold34612_cov165-Amphora_coffeaeformis.AAC.7